MTDNAAGVLGATSMVGKVLVPLLVKDGYRVIACSRKARPPGFGTPSVEFRSLGLPAGSVQDEVIPNWVCLAPIWILPEYFPMLERNQAKRLVALSSTSVFAKRDSTDPAERELAEKLARAEQGLMIWAESRGVEWIILRPTLIYGRGQDRNICVIARFIARFGFFPLLGKGAGRRQPVHVDDVAGTCASALSNRKISNHAYNLSGQEVLTYRDMVVRVFEALGKKERFISIPLPAFRAAIACLRVLPPFSKWSAAMAERMNADLLFDHAEATRDIDFSPRPFRPECGERG